MYSNGLKNNYPVKILPKPNSFNIQKRYYSTINKGQKNSLVKLDVADTLINSEHSLNSFSLNSHPFFITGLTDAEGTFSCSVKKNSLYRLGWRVDITFQIGLHKKDLELLKLIKSYFGEIGSIVYSSEMCLFRVSSLKQILKKILPHFDKYPLITQKHADYLLFKQIVMLMVRGEHLKEEGLQAIVNIRASLNLGLSEVLKAAFPYTINVPRPSLHVQKIPHPD